jgi:hypothetical protein
MKVGTSMRRQKSNKRMVPMTLVFRKIGGEPDPAVVAAVHIDARGPHADMLAPVQRFDVVFSVIGGHGKFVSDFLNDFRRRCKGGMQGGVRDSGGITSTHPSNQSDC